MQINLQVSIRGLFSIIIGYMTGKSYIVSDKQE